MSPAAPWRAHLAAALSALAAWWRAELRAGLGSLRPDLRPDLRSGLPAAPPLRLVLRPDADGLGLSLRTPQAAWPPDWSSDGSSDGSSDLSAGRVAWAADVPAALAHARAEAARAAARAGLGAGPVPLSLALPHAVGRSLSLPRRALPQAEAIVREEICRKTPLRREEIALACAVAPGGGDRVRVHYLVVPDSLIERTLARLGLKRGEIASLEGEIAWPEGEMASPEAACLVLPFGPARAPARASAGRAAAGLGLACLTLVLTGFCGLAGRQAARIGTLEAEIRAVDAPARGSAARLRGVEGLVADAGRLTQLRAAPGVVALWEELARLLPATTYLSEIAVSGEGVSLTGYSEGAAELIGRLQGSHLLQAPVLAGPIVFDRARARERFSIRATLRETRIPEELGRP